MADELLGDRASDEPADNAVTMPTHDDAVGSAVSGGGDQGSGRIAVDRLETPVDAAFTYHSFGGGPATSFHRVKGLTDRPATHDPISSTSSTR